MRFFIIYSFIEFLSKYLTAYFSLSTILPKYKSAYENSNQKYESDLGVATTTINTNILDILSQYDKDFDNALTTVKNITPLYHHGVSEYEKLNKLYKSPTIEMPINMFTSDEMAFLLNVSTYISSNVSTNKSTFNGVQTGGLSVRMHTIEIPRKDYSDETITSKYLSSISTNDSIIRRDERRIEYLNNICIRTLEDYQAADAKNQAALSIKESIDKQKNAVQSILDANNTALDSLLLQSTILGKASKEYNTNIVRNTSETLATSLSQIKTVLNSFDESTINDVKIIVKFKKGELARIEADYPDSKNYSEYLDAIEYNLNLYLKLNHHINLYNINNTVKEYKKYGDIIYDWFKVRKEFYIKRVER
jgi:hypothetical protein